MQFFAIDGGMNEAEEFFSQVYQMRWPQLREALGNGKKVSWYNAFLKKKENISFKGIEGVALDQEASIMRDPDSGLLEHYVLDAASVVCAKVLAQNQPEIVLDMCASPGGKTLVMLGDLGREARVFANEWSMPRRLNLKKILAQYVPPLVLERVKVVGIDAAQYGLRFPNHFDAILLDAPCGSEAHLIKDKRKWDSWSKKRSLGLKQKQYAMLCSALLALKSGGRLVYSTCSISPFENDDVVNMFLTKKHEQVSLDEGSVPGDIPFEKTPYGYFYLPDRSGCGPLYFAVFKKKSYAAT